MNRCLPILLALLSIGCVTDAASDDEPGTTTESQLEWMERHTDDYLHDASWRRARMKEALWKPELSYARKRISGYAKEEGGWDLLSEIDSTTGRVAATDDQPEPRTLSTKTPQTRGEWLALGEDVFWNMPMRAAPYLQWLAGQPDLWDEVGIQRNPDGTVRGLARFRTARGEEAVGATCGLCHGNGGIAGQAAPTLDLGLARARFTEALGGDPETFDAWPAGTIDVTDDGVIDPVAIPNLWSVEHNSYLNASGVIRMTTPAALAVRLETQYLVGHSLEARPNRNQVWALSMYVLALDAPERAPAPKEHPGTDVFDQHCASCHIPARAYAGDLIPAESLTSDPQAAFSAYRGTEHYKVPSLVGVSDGGPFLHDNSAADLEQLLELPHPYAIDLEPQEQQDLLSFLNTL